MPAATTAAGQLCNNCGRSRPRVAPATTVCLTPLVLTVLPISHGCCCMRALQGWSLRQEPRHGTWHQDNRCVVFRPNAKHATLTLLLHWWVSPVDLSRNNNKVLSERLENREGASRSAATTKQRDLLKNTFGSSQAAALLSVSTVCWELLLFCGAAGC